MATALLPRFWAGETTDEAEATDALAQDWRGERVWAHPPPFLMPQFAQFLRAQPETDALVCATFWPGTAWYAEMLELSSETLFFPAGLLRRVAWDAPARLESWPVVIFWVPPRR